MSLRKETWAAVAVSALVHLAAAGVLLIGGGEKARAPRMQAGESPSAPPPPGGTPTRVRLVAPKMVSGYISEAPGGKSSLTPFSRRPAVLPSQPSDLESPGSAPASVSASGASDGEGANGERASGTGEAVAGRGPSGVGASEAPGGSAGTVSESPEGSGPAEAGEAPDGTPTAPSELQRRLAGAARGCYPEQARRMRLEGTLLLKLCLDGAGAAATVGVLSGSGLAVLDRAATECVVARALPVPGVGPGCFQVPVVFGRAR